MRREEMLSAMKVRGEPWDFVIIGGGATGVGVAVDAASRGYDVLLLEQSDLGKGTSSRSTKLVHGGVRYLQQGNVSLVMEALRERGVLRRNAPHLVHEQRFVVPNYAWWEAPFYGLGMRVYDLLARKYSFGTSRNLSKKATLQAIPTLRHEGLRGGVQYFDGQFDDARLLINLAQTAAEQGATLINYAPVIGLTRDGEGIIDGIDFLDSESGIEYHAAAKVVVNATGAFCDAVRRMVDGDASPMIAPSQGVHLVLDRAFLPGDTAIMVPHTADGRVMFAIPWQGRVVVGTTDTPITEVSLEPRALPSEVEFILETAGRYLARRPTRADVLSVFTGIRPLVKASAPGGTLADDTAKLSRDHTIRIESSGLLTITGGKWTTYRHMAEDAVNQAATLAGLEDRPCVTRDLSIHGHPADAASSTGASPASSSKHDDALTVYGSDAAALRALIDADPAMGELLHPHLPYPVALVVWAARQEMARTVDDVLARRTRALLLDAQAAVEASPRVAALLAAELGRDEAWQRQQVEGFVEMAKGYTLGQR